MSDKSDESSEELYKPVATPGGRRESNFGGVALATRGSPGRGSFQGVESPKRESILSSTSPGGSKRDSVSRSFAALDPKKSFTSATNIENAITPQVFAPEFATLPSSRSPRHDAAKVGAEPRRSSALSSSYRDPADMDAHIGRRTSIAALTASQRLEFPNIPTAEPPLSPDIRSTPRDVKKGSPTSNTPRSPPTKDPPSPFNSASKVSSKNEDEPSPRLSLSANLHKHPDSRKSSFDVGSPDPPPAAKPSMKPSAAILQLLNLDENGQPLEPRPGDTVKSDPPFLDVSRKESSITNVSSRRGSEQSQQSKLSSFSGRRSIAQPGTRRDSEKPTSGVWGEKKPSPELLHRNSIVEMVHQQQQQQKFQGRKEESYSESSTAEEDDEGVGQPSSSSKSSSSGSGSDHKKDIVSSPPQQQPPPVDIQQKTYVVDMPSVTQSQLSSPSSLMRERQPTAPMGAQLGAELDIGLMKRLQAHSSTATESSPDSASRTSYLPISGTESRLPADDLLGDIKRLQNEAMLFRQDAASVDEDPSDVAVSAMFEFLKIDITSPHVLFAGSAQRWSSSNRSEQKLHRMVLVTKSALYTWTDLGTLQRCVPIQGIDKILMSEDGWIGIGIPLEFDMLLRFTSSDPDGFVKALAASDPGSLFIDSKKSVTEIIPELSLGRPAGWFLNPDSVVPITPCQKTGLSQPLTTTDHARCPRQKAQYIDIGRLLWQPSVGAVPLVTAHAPVVAFGTAAAPSE